MGKFHFATYPQRLWSHRKSLGEAVLFVAVLGLKDI